MKVSCRRKFKDFAKRKISNIPELSIITEYLRNKFHRSQVGFVLRMRIQVNLLRAICVAKILTEKNKRCRYKLFIDFANAYNTVPHTLLFQKLRQKKFMSEDK